MSYESDRGPRIIVGTVGLVVLGLFLLAMAQAVVPYFYEKYQRHRLHQCEEEFAVAEGAWKPVFGFDMGGRHIIGDSPESRALIECIAGSQSVRNSATPLYQDYSDSHPALSITFSSFSNGLGFEYYAGRKATEAKSH